MYAELEYGTTGMWELPYGQSFGQDISRMKESRYLWGIDSEGKLFTMDDPADDGIMIKFVAWVRIDNDPSQVILSTVENARNAVEVFDVGRYIYGCVVPSTGEIHLNTNGRTHILFCNASFYMASIDHTTDPNWDYCVEVFPKDPSVV